MSRVSKIRKHRQLMQAEQYAAYVRHTLNAEKHPRPVTKEKNQHLVTPKRIPAQM